MKKSLNCILPVLLYLLMANLFAAQQIPKIGIVDSERVALTFILHSKAYQDLQNLKTEIEKKTALIKAEIQELEKQKLAAFDTGAEAEEMNLKNQIVQKQSYLNDYIRYGKNELASKRTEIAVSDEFYANMLKAIKTIAEEGGFSLIIDKAINSIWYYTSEIDITEAVIKSLNKKYG